jgi:RNA polymerase sigma-70 factor (ECF subfamily)
LALTQTEFNRLVDEYGPTLYRIAYRMVGDGHVAEDIVQETFRSAWKGRRRYEPGRGDRAWLATILRRRVVDLWRRKKPIDTIGGDAVYEIVVDDPDPLADELSSQLQEGLSKLAKPLRETLLLVVVGDLTHQEVADMLGIPIGTVLSRVSRARTRLRQHMIDLATT